MVKHPTEQCDGTDRGRSWHHIPTPLHIFANYANMARRGIIAPPICAKRITFFFFSSPRGHVYLYILFPGVHARIFQFIISHCSSVTSLTEQQRRGYWSFLVHLAWIIGHCIDWPERVVRSSIDYIYITASLYMSSPIARNRSQSHEESGRRTRLLLFIVGSIATLLIAIFVSTEHVKLSAFFFRRLPRLLSLSGSGTAARISTLRDQQFNNTMGSRTPVYFFSHGGVSFRSHYYILNYDIFDCDCLTSWKIYSPMLCTKLDIRRMLC